ncbi:MAG TPA: non-heme iron oxygenase ferredoxin subunit [Dermatophilaceae bacterium]|jgi:3-phenylpropionate/trans-cinnamate dioxygenase ferredoxin subunit
MTETTAVTADVTAGMTDGYVRVCSVNDLPTVGAVQVEIDDKQVAIVRDSAGNIHAIDDTCSHANVSLSEGDVEDGAIECWLHGSRFDLRTGEPTSPPAITPIAVYPVKINGGDVFVSVTKEN